MTPEQTYERWERIARLLYEDGTHRRSESRKQTAKLKIYLDADRRHGAARRELAEDPENFEMMKLSTWQGNRLGSSSRRP
jgi:hypothetical protein